MDSYQPPKAQQALYLQGHKACTHTVAQLFNAVGMLANCGLRRRSG